MITPMKKVPNCIFIFSLMDSFPKKPSNKFNIAFPRLL